MRALIMASASFETVMAPSRTWATNSFTRFFPRSRATGSFARRPSCTIWSSRLVSTVCSAPDWGIAARCGSLIGALRDSHLGAQLSQLVLVGHGFTQRFFEFVVALHASAKIREAVAQFE